MSDDLWQKCEPVFLIVTDPYQLIHLISARCCCLTFVWSHRPLFTLCCHLLLSFSLAAHLSSPAHYTNPCHHELLVQTDFCLCGAVVTWRGNIIRTALCWIVWHNVHSPQHTYMRSSYRSNRLGLSHWDPYAVHRGGCLELYYCNMVEWFWWDSSLIFDDQLVFFSAPYVTFHASPKSPYLVRSSQHIS